ncbi:MAG: hypothetical protein AB1646_15520 [Thermodesulfobacteriota bacterium]
MKSPVTREIVNELNCTVLDDQAHALRLADLIIGLLRTSEDDFGIIKQTGWYKDIWRFLGGPTLERVGAACQRAFQAQSLAMALLKLTALRTPQGLGIVVFMADEIAHLRDRFGDSAVPDSGLTSAIAELARGIRSPQGPNLDEQDLPKETRIFIVRAMIATARIDQRLDETEVDLISRKIESLGLGEDEQSSIRAEIFDPKPFRIELESLEGYRVRHLLYRNVAAVVLADGAIHVKEKALLEKLVRDLGVKRQDAARIERELTQIQSVSGLDDLVAAVVRNAEPERLRISAGTGEETTAPDVKSRELTQRKLSESWLTYIGTLADFSRNFLQAPLIRRIEGYHRATGILAGFDIMAEAAIRDEVLSAAEAFCTLSSRSIDDNLIRMFPTIGSEFGVLWSETVAQRVASSVRDDLQECFRNLEDASRYQTRLRELDEPVLEEINSSLLQGIQMGGTLVGLESGAISTAALHGSYGWLNRDRLDPVAADLFDAHSERLGLFYLAFDDALDEIATRFWETGVRYFEETLVTLLAGLEPGFEPLSGFFVPPAEADSWQRRAALWEDHAESPAGPAREAPRDLEQTGIIEPRVPRCRECGAEPANRVLWGRRLCDKCYEKNDFKAVIKDALKKSVTGGGIYLAPEIPPAKLKNARQSCEVADDDETIALIDCTLFGSASDCVMFCESGIYGRNLRQPVSFIPYHALPGAVIIESVDDMHCIWVGEKGLMNLKGSDVPRNEMLDLLKRLQRLARDKWSTTDTQTDHR